MTRHDHLLVTKLLRDIAGTRTGYLREKSCRRFKLKIEKTYFNPSLREKSANRYNEDDIDSSMDRVYNRMMEGPRR